MFRARDLKPCRILAPPSDILHSLGPRMSAVANVGLQESVFARSSLGSDERIVASWREEVSRVPGKGGGGVGVSS